MAEHDTPTAESGAHSDATGFAHVSVMRDEIVEVLSEVPDGIVVDATLGGAGHAAALLAANDGISILGLDRDEMALAAASARLAAHGDRVTVRHTRFDGLAAAVQSLVAVALEDPCEGPFVGGVDEIGGRATLAAIHSHVERPVVAEAETSVGEVKLWRTHAEVEQCARQPFGAERLHRRSETVEASVADRNPIAVRSESSAGGG